MIDELFFREDDVGGNARVTTDEVKYTSICIAHFYANRLKCA